VTNNSAILVGSGHKVGIVGLGGLGHMGVKLAHAMGAHVVLFTTSVNKKADALRLGADEVVISKDPEQMATHLKSFDFQAPIFGRLSDWRHCGNAGGARFCA
jgi:D-arabinose 1-dehydrogenase-like Zn-dependent alcohol dehydrogenase